VLQRLGEIAQPASFAERINRAQVWAIFDSRFHSSTSWVGLGPRYPFETFGVFPHSAWKSLLVLGGIPALAGALILLVTIVVRAIRASVTVRSSLTIAYFVVPVVIVADQIKVEFTRTGPYAIWFTAMLVLIGQSCLSVSRSALPASPQTPRQLSQMQQPRPAMAAAADGVYA